MQRARAAEFAKFGPPIGHGVIVNGWARPAVVGNYNTDYVARTLITYGGIWANVMPEVLYYRASTDGAGEKLSGDNSYTLTRSVASVLAPFGVIVIDETADVRMSA